MRTNTLSTIFVATCFRSLHSVNANSVLENTAGQLRGKQQLSDSNSIHCRVTLVHTTFVSDDQSSSIDEHQTSCIPINDGIELDDMFPITLPESFHDQHKQQIRSGSLMVSISSAALTSNGIETTDQSQYRLMNNVPQRFRELQAKDLQWKPTMTVAVVRISTTDSSPTDSAAALKTAYFNSDINFSKQYDACSSGQLNWKLSKAGVVDVKVDQTIASYGSAAALITDAQNKLKTQLGISGVDALADKVIMCVPPGTGSWAGSAGVKHWRVQLNNDWCRSLSGTMHELAHTMGLLHAHADGIEYNDRTGYMGSGYTDPDGPIKCFNGYNSYLFGWYSSHHLDLNLGKDDGRVVSLAAFVDYDKASSSDSVVINIGNTYYLVYNRKKGFNSGTEQKQDQITITQPIETGTNNVAGLGPGNKAEISNFQGLGDLVIEACEKGTGSKGADVMLVSIAIGKSLCGTESASSVAKPTNNKPDTSVAPANRQPVKPLTDFLVWLKGVLGK